MSEGQVSRRTFLRGAIALAAATQLPSAAFASAPTIYGDGQHDDTAGLQALFDSKPFRVVGKGVFARNGNGRIALAGGTFKVSAMLTVRENTSVTDCTFIRDNAGNHDAAIYLKPHSRIERICVVCSPYLAHTSSTPSRSVA